MQQASKWIVGIGLLSLLAAPVFAALPQPAGQANTEHVAGYFAGPAPGEWTLTPLGDDLPNDVYVSGVTGDIANDGSIQTFCMEKEENIDETGTVVYDVELNDKAIEGGVGPAGDLLDARTAWLYAQFVAGTLMGKNAACEDTTAYDYTPDLANPNDPGDVGYEPGLRASDARYLQKAIWFIEEEQGSLYGRGREFLNAATCANPSDIGDVLVLNLTVDADPPLRQDLLYIPPEREPICGDGNVDVDLGETCDPPGEDGCRDDCTYCGDGVVDEGEECDPADTSGPDNCRDDCTYCGDGVVDEGEECDPADTSGPDNCRDDCTYCGDGILDEGEDCDDGNNQDGDGCSAECTVERCQVCEGCTPGYWKQRHHLDSWVGADPDDSYNTTFGVDAFDPDITLLEALKQGGGGVKALGRHSVAALLNSMNTDVDYLFTTAEVIAMVQEALDGGGRSVEEIKDLLADENELGCPLD